MVIGCTLIFGQDELSVRLDFVDKFIRNTELGKKEGGG